MLYLSTPLPARIACAFAALVAFSVSCGHAAADDLKAAVKSVSSMSDEELRAEYQKRLKARRQTSVSSRRLGSTRGLSRGLSTLADVSDSTFTQAIRDTGRSRTIYGPLDARREWHEITDDSVLSLAKASVALVRAESVEASGDKAHLKTTLLGKERRLCTGEKFESEPVAAFCSGTLVGPDMVLTAGHCIRDTDPIKATNVPYAKSTKFVFGYWVKEGDPNPVDIPASQIFTGQRIEKYDTNADWVLVRLDRPVPPIAEPVVNWDPAFVKNDRKVFVIGYPDGIPLKYAPGAKVIDSSNSISFVANLDTFGGNSGSGVYDQTTKTLVGILRCGGNDYLPADPDDPNSCYQAQFCPSSGTEGSACQADCSGEKVIRISGVPHP